jgi:hypothetical protein
LPYGVYLQKPAGERVVAAGVEVVQIKVKIFGEVFALVQGIGLWGRNLHISVKELSDAKLTVYLLYFFGFTLSIYRFQSASRFQNHFFSSIQQSS